jgi:nitrate/nitrite transporter NarK
MGVYTSATSLGVLIANLVVPWLISVFDWTASYRGFGLVSVLAGVFCYILLRPGPVVTFVPRSDGRAKSVARTLLANPNLILLALAGFGGFWGTYGFVIWSNTLIVTGRGFDPRTAGGIVAVFATMGILGKPIVGAVSDWLGGARRVPAMVMLGLFTVMLIVFGLAETPTAFVVAAPLLGLSGYCYLPMMVALVPRLVDTSMLGTAAGAINAFWQVGSVLVPLAVGAVFVAAGNSFIAAFATLAIGPLLGMVAMFFVNERPVDVRIAVAEEPIL